MKADNFTPFAAGVLATLMGFIAVRSGDLATFLFFGAFAALFAYAALRKT
jgi:hypothetical protein